MRSRFKTARCILYRDGKYLLAVHNSFRHRRLERWGLPGGQVEWGEPPARTARRELREELHIQVDELHEIGAFVYKRAEHMVYAAPFSGDIARFDRSELLDIGWFDEAAIARLQEAQRLHAGYELEAVQTLRNLLAGPTPSPRHQSR